ncbi:hypothetical protein V7139_31795, partial [Neobacillus drentensis]|uniref:hypothetical protein n=1 Tax=Neobacillus drentensis TaxID=220684 RepID=UPI0030010DDA
SKDNDTFHYDKVTEVEGEGANNGVSSAANSIPPRVSAVQGLKQALNLLNVLFIVFLGILLR